MSFNVILDHNPNTGNNMQGKYPRGSAPALESSIMAAIMAALGIDVNPQPTGTTYYLDNTHGSTSDTNDGLTASTPWQTIGKALSTLTAGDMVVGEGTYTQGSDLVQANSGTVGNPIIYRAKTPLSFKIDQLGANNGFSYDVNSINYTVIDGLEIKNIYGNGGVYTKDDNQSIHVFNCHIHDIDNVGGANAGCIRFDKQSGGVAYNNHLHTVRINGIDNDNAASIHGYGQDEAIIAFNKMSDASMGISLKNSKTVNNFKLIANDIAALTHSIYLNVIGASQPAVAMLNAQIYGNLIRSGSIYLKCYEHNPQSENMIFRNNVLLEEGIVNFVLKALQMYDNIFDFDSTNEATTAITTQRRDLYSLGRVSTITYSDYNNFHSGSKFTTNRYGNLGGYDGGVEVTRMSLAAWRAQVINDGFETIQVNNPDSSSTQLLNQFDPDYITQNTALLTGGRFGGQIGLEYKAGPDWSNI